jgi:mRNA interferase MazF
MTRGELYRVFRPSGDDPRRSRVFVVVSRPAFIQSSSSTVICAPVYSSYHGLESQVLVGLDEGLKQQSAVHCDALVSLPKSTLTNYVGRLSSAKMSQLNHALAVALGWG